MPYNPGVVDQRGQLLAQGITGGIQGGVDGFKQYQQNKLRNQAIQGENEALLKIFSQDPEMQKYAPEGMDKFMEKSVKGGGLSLKDNVQLNGLLNTTIKTRGLIQEQQAQRQQQEMAKQQMEMQRIQMEEMKRKQAIAAEQQAQLERIKQFSKLSQTNGVLRADVQDGMAARMENNPFLKARAQAAEAGLDMSGETAAQFIAATGRTGGINYKTRREDDPKTGRTYEVTVDGNTGKEVSRGTVMQPQRPVLSPEEEAKKLELTGRTSGALKTNDGYIEAGQKAVADLRSYETALKLLDTTRTGAAANLEVSTKRLGELFGFKSEDVKNQEHLQQLLGDAVMKRVNETKGGVSEKEMVLFDLYSASMNKTPEGNKAILGVLKKQAERSREIARDVQAMRRAGKSDVEIQQAINDRLLEAPIFDEKDEAAIGGAAAIPKWDDSKEKRLQELKAKLGK